MVCLTLPLTRSRVLWKRPPFLSVPELRRVAPIVSVRDRAARGRAGQRRSWPISGSVYVLEERVVVVPAAGVWARVVRAVGDGGCRPWVLAVFSPSGTICTRNYFVSIVAIESVVMTTRWWSVRARHVHSCTPRALLHHNILRIAGRVFFVVVVRLPFVGHYLLPFFTVATQFYE